MKRGTMDAPQPVDAPLRPRLRRRLHVAAHWGGFRLRRAKRCFAFPPPPSLGEGGLRRPPLRGGCHEVTGGVRAAQQTVITMDTTRAR